MNNFFKSHMLIVIISLCLITFLSFHALEKNNCFKINISEELNIEAACY